MLPHALMLAATGITVPEDGTDDAAGEDAAGAGEDTGADVIAECEEPADGEVGTTADGGEDATAAGAELLADGEAVLDEPQAVSPTARTTAAAGRNADRRNITELSRVGIAQMDGGRLDPEASSPAGPLRGANRVLIVVVNISDAGYAAVMASPAASQEPGEPAQLTRGTVRVFSLLGGHDRPIAAQELWAQMRAAGDTTGLATVYRALHALAAAGLVHQFRHDGETTYRACGPGHHDHLVCRTCGRVQERRTAELDRQLAQLSEDGFTAEDCLIEIYGRCSTCS